MDRQELDQAVLRPQYADNGSFIVTLRETFGTVILGAVVVYLLVALERAHRRERDLLRQRIERG